MKCSSYGLIGAFVGLLIVYLAENLHMPAEQGFGARLVLIPLIGSMIGAFFARRHA
jgi:hypothetical protein